MKRPHHHPASALGQLKAILRKSAAELLTTADILQFLEGLDASDPTIVEPAAIENVNQAVIHVLAQQAALDEAVSALMQQVTTGAHALKVANVLAAFAAFTRDAHATSQRPNRGNMQ